MSGSQDIKVSSQTFQVSQNLEGLSYSFAAIDAQPRRNAGFQQLGAARQEDTHQHERKDWDEEFRSLKAVGILGY